MSNQDWAKLESDATETVVTVLWRQWRALGGGASGRPAVGLIDPEALILGSLHLAGVEKRLWTVMSDWLLNGSRFLSVQRLRNLRPAFRGVDLRLSELAQFAVDEARDARWRVLIEKGARVHAKAGLEAESRRRSSELVLNTPATLMLRLRAAFGVGLKADLLTFLLGQRYRTTVATAAHALGYSTPHVFRGLQDLLVARFVQTTEIPAATEYAVQAVPFSAWSTLLGLNDVVDWRPWKEAIGYGIRVIRWLGHRKSESVSDYAAVVALRGLAEEWRAESMRAGVTNILPPAAGGSDIGAWRKHTRASMATMAKWV